LRLFTNRGRGLIARALQSLEHTIPADPNDKFPEPKKLNVRDGVNYENVKVLYLDVPFNLGSIQRRARSGVWVLCGAAMLNNLSKIWLCTLEMLATWLTAKTSHFFRG
jgi:hypothetical protein